MMEKSLREKAVMATLGVIVLYALAVGMWFLSAERAWKTAARAYAAARDAYRREVKLIGEKRLWTEKYETERAAMRTFEVGKATGTTWGRLLRKIAETNHVAIINLDTGAEIEADDVLVLPLEIKSWEGSLESLTHMMYELENTPEGMFDIVALHIIPNSAKKGYLRGSFTLNCAYTRER